jgi:two-component system chemotaxis response regulator CheB
VLNARSSLPVAYAQDGESIHRGRIYIAPPNRHLLLTIDGIQLSEGARENRFRPAIDPLFRSAAKCYGSRVIGVVLTGMLDDGTQGLWFIKRFGGITIVQDPNEAEAPSMPASAIEADVVDHVLSLIKMPALLTQLAHESSFKAVHGQGAVLMPSNSDDQKLEDLHPADT